MGLHEHEHDWRAIFFYGIVSVLVLGAGVIVLWSFFERQHLQTKIVAEPLPKVTVLTPRADDRLAAAWVSLLTDAGFNATLVSFDRFAPAADALIAVRSDQPLPATASAALSASLADAGGVIILGSVPPRFVDSSLRSETQTSAGAIRFSEIASPVLARVQPGYEVGASGVPVSVIAESPQMVVDARWSESARAAIAHWSSGAGRVVWLGFDPGALHYTKDRQLALLLRTSLRWASGQPVSDGASGIANAAKALDASARLAAREQRLVFSVDKLDDRGRLALTMANRGNRPIENATVKVWLPKGARRCSMRAPFWERRGVTMTASPGENAVVVTVPRLGAFEERIVQLRAR